MATKSLEQSQLMFNIKTQRNQWIECESMSTKIVKFTQNMASNQKSFNGKNFN